MTYIRGLGVRVHVFAEASKLHFRSLANTREAPEPTKCPLVKVPFSISKLQAKLVKTPAAHEPNEATESTLAKSDESSSENATLTLEFELTASVACSAVVLCNLEKAVLAAPVGNTATDPGEEDTVPTTATTDHSNVSPSASSEEGARSSAAQRRIVSSSNGNDEEAGIELQPVTPQLLPRRTTGRGRGGFVRLPAVDAADDDDDQDHNDLNQHGAAAEEIDVSASSRNHTALPLPSLSDEEEMDGDGTRLQRNSHEAEATSVAAAKPADSSTTTAVGAAIASQLQIILEQASKTEPRGVAVKVDLPPGYESLLFPRRPDVYQLVLALRPLHDSDDAILTNSDMTNTQAALRSLDHSNSDQHRDFQENVSFAARVGQSAAKSVHDKGPKYARVTNNAPATPAAESSARATITADVSSGNASQLLGLDRVRSHSSTSIANAGLAFSDREDELLSHLLVLDVDRTEENHGGTSSSASGSGCGGGGGKRGTGSGDGEGSTNNNSGSTELQSLRVRVASQVNVTTRGVYTTQSIFGLIDRSSASGDGNNSDTASDGSPTSGSGSSTGDGNQDGEAESSECVICLTDQRDTVLLPCRHLCCCQACFPHLDKCPVCRAPFDSHVVFEHKSDDEASSDQEAADTNDRKREGNEDKGNSSSPPARSAVLTSTPSPLHTGSAQQEDRVHEDIL